MATTLIVALAMAVQVGGPAKKGPKRPYVSKDGGFSVALPGNPTRQKQTVQTPVGPIDVAMFIVEVPKATYFVAYSDYPADVIAKSDPKKILDGAQDGAIANVKGQLVSDGEIELDGNPGREFDFELPEEGGPVPGGGLGKARIFLVKRRLYQVMVMGSKDTVGDQASEQFLKSFKLAARKASDAPKADRAP